MVQAGSFAPPDPAALARDRQLVADVLVGNAERADELAQRLSIVPRLFSVLNARRSSRLSPQDLEDLSQETLMRIWKKLGSYHGEATLEGWLHRFCFLEFMNRARSESRRPDAASGPLEILEANVVAPDSNFEREDLEQSLEALGPPDSDAVRLKHYEDLSFEGVASVLGITTKMAKTRYYRGIAWLQRELSAKWQERRA